MFWHTQRRLRDHIDMLVRILAGSIVKINAKLEMIQETVDRIAAHVDNVEGNTEKLESMMSEELDALTEIKTKLDDLLDDVKARWNVLAGELSAEGKTEAASINEAIDAFQAEIGDADGSDNETPVVEETPGV